jgi:hypothetical protein
LPVTHKLKDLRVADVPSGSSARPHYVACGRINLSNKSPVGAQKPRAAHGHASRAGAIASDLLERPGDNPTITRHLEGIVRHRDFGFTCFGCAGCYTFSSFNPGSRDIRASHSSRSFTNSARVQE